MAEAKNEMDAVLNRIEVLEQTLASVTGDHTGHLLALQAITAVLTVRLMGSSSDPVQTMEEARTWAHRIVETTNPAATLSEETASKMRQIADEKITRFFDGIKIKKSE